MSINGAVTRADLLVDLGTHGQRHTLTLYLTVLCLSQEGSHVKEFSLCSSLLLGKVNQDNICSLKYLKFLNTYLKFSVWGLETWFRSQDYLLLSRGPGFDSQNPYGNSQLFVIPRSLAQTYKKAKHQCT